MIHFSCNLKKKLEYLYEKNKQYFLNNKRGKELYILSYGSLVLLIVYMLDKEQFKYARYLSKESCV